MITLSWGIFLIFIQSYLVILPKNIPLYHGLDYAQWSIAELMCVKRCVRVQEVTEVSQDAVVINDDEDDEDEDDDDSLDEEDDDEDGLGLSALQGEDIEVCRDHTHSPFGHSK